LNRIEEPKKRSSIRKLFGKEYFILKRRFNWSFDTKNYAKKNKHVDYTNSVFKHRSMILRPLKDVDMYLQENKRTNLKLAIQHMNEVEIKPDETFSIWKLVGRPTKSKGYLDGLVLNGGKIEKGTGGGLCQLGNLLFWVFAHSPLDVIERYRHGYDVFPDVNRKVPFGAGATLSYNYIDLQVKNNTKNGFQLKFWMDDTYLYGELFAKDEVLEKYEVVERDHSIQHQFWGGYSRHNRIVKRTILGDNVDESLIVENHAIMMYEPFLEDKSSKKTEE